MNLRNKVAWICGGNRMGVAVAQALSKRGCRIVLTYRKSKKQAEDAVRQLTTEGGQAVAFQCDLTNKKQIDKTAAQIFRLYKNLDILVNLSSIYEKTSLSNVRLTAIGWDNHLNTNTRSAYDLSLAVAPWMERGEGGRVIHVSDWTSASGRPRYKDFAPYYVSKVAIKGLVEALALEFAPKILVNAIAPGPMLPPPDLSVSDYDAVVKATPLSRWGGTEEIAKAVLFLVDTDFVTGETIRVDGGRHLS